MTLEEMERYFPEGIGNMTLEYRQEVHKHRPVYFFRDDSKSPAICYHCRKVVMGNGIGHKESHVCPWCGHGGKMINANKYHGGSEMISLRQEDLLYIYQPSKIDPEILTCTVIYTMWYFSQEDPTHTEPFSYIDARYLFIPGKGGVYAAKPHKLWKAMFCNGEFAEYPHCSIDPRYEPMKVHKSCKDRINMYLHRTELNIYVESAYDLNKLVAGTSMRYAVDTYSDWITPENHIELLDKLYKWPKAMEQLGKIGLVDTIEMAVRQGNSLGKIFNMRGKNLWKVLKCRFSKEDLAFILMTTGVIDLQDIESYRRFKKLPMAKGISMREAVALGSCWGVDLVMKYVKLKKALRYVKKQNSDMQTYVDYLRDCERLEMDLTSKSVLFPKNLERIHVELQDQIKHRADEAAREKWDKRYMECVEKYCYASEGYCIIVPEDIRDLVREGKDMHNCVGGYIARVAAGDTDVVYIRKLDALQESFGTMEICEGEIIQARGKYNKDLPEDAKAFVEQFRKNMLSPQRIKRKKAV